MWDLPYPGIEPVSPALVGRFFTTEPLGKPLNYLILLMTEKHPSLLYFKIYQKILKVKEPKNLVSKTGLPDTDKHSFVYLGPSPRFGILC